MGNNCCLGREKPPAPARRKEAAALRRLVQQPFEGKGEDCCSSHANNACGDAGSLQPEMIACQRRQKEEDGLSSPTESTCDNDSCDHPQELPDTEDLEKMPGALRADMDKVHDKSSSLVEMRSTTRQSGAEKALTAVGDGFEMPRTASPSTATFATTSRGSPEGKLGLDALKLHGMVGCGTFGAVFKVEERKTRKLYAFKIMSKSFVAQEGLQDAVFQEKDLQMSCNSPFVIRLYKTFDTPTKLCMLLELALGDLATTYLSHDLIGNVACVKFHSAGAMLALNYLHSAGICFRDMKPENILLNAEGNVKLGDFGCAKRIGSSKTYTICGTAGFLAPEMQIPGRGYDVQVDVYALGITILVYASFKLIDPPKVDTCSTPLAACYKEDTTRTSWMATQHARSAGFARKIHSSDVQSM